MKKHIPKLILVCSGICLLIAIIIGVDDALCGLQFSIRYDTSRLQIFLLFSFVLFLALYYITDTLGKK